MCGRRWEGASIALERRPGGGATVGRPAPLPTLPSLASFRRLQQKPELLETDRGLLEEFEAAPWLLPPRTTALPYAGVHGFDELVALRATAEPGADRAVTILLFNKVWAVMAQNSGEFRNSGDA